MNNRKIEIKAQEIVAYNGALPKEQYVFIAPKTKGDRIVISKDGILIDEATNNKEKEEIINGIKNIIKFLNIDIIDGDVINIDGHLKCFIKAVEAKRIPNTDYMIIVLKHIKDNYSSEKIDVLSYKKILNNEALIKKECNNLKEGDSLLVRSSKSHYKDWLYEYNTTPTNIIEHERIKQEDIKEDKKEKPAKKKHKKK